MNVKPPETLVIIESIVYKSNSFAIAIDRTQWRAQNVFMLSLIWEKRSIPLYWLLLDKKRSSNIGEQKALIIPVLELYHFSQNMQQ